jgi:hypothetical protein
MRTAIPTEMLTRLASATPEVYAAVERLLGMTENQTAADAGGEPASDELALKLFALVKALESERPYRKVPMLQVFRLYCLESLSCRQIAKVCRCSLALVADRLKALEQKLGRKPQALRAYSAAFERIADSMTDPRARRLRPQDALNGEENEEI